MDENNRSESTDDSPVETDGGTVTQATQDHRNTDYLSSEVNILNPSTSFMRDHLRVIWTGFILWAIIVFGPVTLTAIAPDLMTSQMPVLGFPLHYFLVAIGAPSGALILAFWYARRRDALDDKYGIDHGTVGETGGRGGEEAAATDGGVDE
jgi:putative solute:sodium symporter small subunit